MRPKQNARHLILHKYGTKTDQLFFFLISLIKKILFALFFVKVQLNQNRTSSEAF